MNLSGKVVSSQTLQLLSKGLKFVPSSKKWFEFSEFNSNIRKIINFSFFSNTDSNLNTSSDLSSLRKLNMRLMPIPTHQDRISKLKKRTRWSPSIHSVNDSTQKLVLDLQDLFYHCYSLQSSLLKCSHFNISPKQISCIRKFFSLYPDIIIKPADKGGVICLMDLDSYKKEVLRQLSDHTYYRTVSYSEVVADYDELHRIILDMLHLNLISLDTFEYILPPDDPKFRCFYGLPKIHKPLDKWISNVRPFMPKIRPIISGTNSDTWCLSQFLNTFLISHSQSHPSYLKDTGDFLQTISDLVVPQDSFLVSLDIESLYTNLSHDECLEALHDIFDKEDDPIFPFIIALFDYVVRHNDFEFDGRFFRQVRGVSIGGIISPQLADIICARFEKKLFSTLKLLPIFWKRFLDDVFAIWTFSSSELNDFLTSLNNFSQFIKFTMEFDRQSTNFLDVTVFKGPFFHLTGILSTKLYTKPTACLTLLDPHSYHPPRTFAGIVLAQITRLSRLSSSTNDFDASVDKLFSTLFQQGYDRSMCFSLLHRVRSGRLLFTSRLSLRSPNNCGPLCSICPLGFILRHKTILRLINWTRIPAVCDTFNCNSKNCIYLLSCPKCSSVYIGQTICLRSRILNHLSDIRLQSSDSALVPHFNKEFLPALTILQNNLPSLELDHWEAFWIHNLSHVFTLLNRKSPQLSRVLPLVMTYNSMNNEFTRRARSIFARSSWVPKKLKPKVVSAFRRNTNLGQCFISSRFNKIPSNKLTKSFNC